MRSVMYCDTEAMIRSTEKSIPDVSPRWRVCPFTSSVKCRDYEVLSMGPKRLVLTLAIRN